MIRSAPAMGGTHDAPNHYACPTRGSYDSAVRIHRNAGPATLHLALAAKVRAMHTSTLDNALPRWLTICVVCALFAVSLLPTLIVDIPALVDYPNHLARMSILSRNATASASTYYMVHWALYPNLAMDAVVPTLAKSLGVTAATKLFYLAAQLLVLTGTTAVGWFAGRRLVLPAAIASLYLYAAPFAYGFVNFEFALGLALWAFAGWLALAHRTPARITLHTMAVGLLFLSHLFALGIYGLLAGAHELSRLMSGRITQRSFAITCAWMATPVAILGIAMHLSGGSVGGAGNAWLLANKAQQLMEANGFSLVASFVLTGCLVLWSLAARRLGAIRMAEGGGTIAIVMAIAYIVIPFRLLDTAFVDVRIAVAAILALAGFVIAEFPQQRLARLAVFALAALSIANSLYVTAVQAEYARDYADLRTALAQTSDRPRIMIVRTGPEEDPPTDRLDYPMYHAAMIAIHTRDALVPTLFAYPGKQPVLPKPEFADLTITQGGPVPFAIAQRTARDRLVVPGIAFVTDWPKKFDYVVLLKPTADNPLPDLLSEIAKSRRFALYKVKR